MYSILCRRLRAGCTPNCSESVFRRISENHGQQSLSFNSSGALVFQCMKSLSVGSESRCGSYRAESGTGPDNGLLTQRAAPQSITFNSMGPVNGWHKGERAMQRKMGYADAMTEAWTLIEPEMTEEHQTFFTSRLPFIPVTTLDDRHRPWSSILAGSDGRPGFATSKHLGELTLNAHVWEGDPFLQNVASESPKSRSTTNQSEPVLIAGIGVELSTRRRNKFAGYIESMENEGPVIHVQSTVNEAIGNCPKYINVRDLVSFPDTQPRVVYRRLELSPDERLPDDVVSFIHESDSLFLGTYYEAGEDGERFPSHVGMNQRAGKPGFARVRPSDGRVLVIPDYSGNRLLASLGNIEATPLAGVTFVSFVTGSVLYLTGEAHNLLGPDAHRLMPRVNALTTIHITGYIFVEDALPVRQRPDTQVQRSPYSPPIRLLAEETTSTYFVDDLKEKPKMTLARIEMHAHDVATFMFESPAHVDIVPGQAAVLDLKSFVGALPYQHMAPANPMSVNDDRIRTWTVSGSSRWASGGSSSSAESTDGAGPVSFALTMRHKPGGAVTSALFTVAHKLSELRPELLEDTRSLQLSVPLVGITGDFTLPTNASSVQGPTAQPTTGPTRDAGTGTGRRKWLWIAGGIGVTPFLAMLAGMQKKILKKGKGTDDADDIVLTLSTREPDVLLPLLLRPLECTDERDHQEGQGHRGTLSIHVFNSWSPASSSSSWVDGVHDRTTELDVEVTEHAGRLSEGALRALDIADMRERQVYLCGPEDFERTVLSALKEIGVDSRDVRREQFAY